MLLDRVLYESAIIFFLNFYLFACHLTGSKILLLFLNDRTISPGHVQVKIVLSMYRLFFNSCFFSGPMSTSMVYDARGV